MGQKRATKPPVGDVRDPDGFFHHMQRYLAHLAEKNYSPRTIETREDYLRYFVSTYNISNSIGVLCNNNDYPLDEKFVNTLLDNNIRLHYLLGGQMPASYREWVAHDLLTDGRQIAGKAAAAFGHDDAGRLMELPRPAIVAQPFPQA